LGVLDLLFKVIHLLSMSLTLFKQIREVVSMLRSKKKAQTHRE